MTSRETMCERCDWLCCRVYDIFDHETDKLVKRAWDKCGYLDISNRCRIHKTRSKHPGFRDSCDIYDCMEWWPIVTLFARRMWDHPNRTSIISSLLETIRLRVEVSPDSRNAILQLSANLLNDLVITESSLSMAIKALRIKIELFKE